MTKYDKYREEHSSKVNSEKLKNMIMNWSDESVKRMIKTDDEKHWKHFQSVRSSRLGVDVTVQLHDKTDKKRYLVGKKDGGTYVRHHYDDVF